MDNLLFKNLEPTEGFYAPEKDGLGAFIWTGGRFALKSPGRDRFLLIRACYYGNDGRLSVRAGNGAVSELELSYGWNTYVLEFGQAETLELELDRVIPVEGDGRALGLMLRSIEAFSDAERFDRLDTQMKNKALNEREFLSGKTRLESYPTRLRIDVEDRCNMAPRCVYCDWDNHKAEEAKSRFFFTPQSFADLGMFFTCAEEVVDCSIGEPFLKNDIFDIIDRALGSDKSFDLVSNGLLLDEDMQKRLCGKEITLAVSLDASNEESYKRLRGEGFGCVVENLRLLCERKKAHNDLPVVNAAFIAMRSNIEEFPDYVRLVKEIGVDNVMLRALSENLERLGLGSDNFNYGEELLSADELSEFVVRAGELAGESGVGLINGWSFGDVEMAGSGPLCREPWDSVYLFKRGVLPCCFTVSPVTHINTTDDGSLHDIAREAFNSEEMREIRTALAQRRLPEWCLKNRGCPIVKKIERKELSR
ncbi:MAG: radical SAM/SPASM domain-containing protein [Thermodesulfobacteriota bacterium]